MKKTWLVKELSILTRISVSTLHYYDEIGLLIPSVRRSNGYRVYTSDDLVRLQRIMALRFLGFPLKKIEELLNVKSNLEQHLHLQKKIVTQKISVLRDIEAALLSALENIASEQNDALSTVLTLIERYRMSKEFETGWKKICTPEEFRDIEVLKKSHSQEQLHSFHGEWNAFLQKAQGFLDRSPEDAESVALVKSGNELFARIYKDTPRLLGALKRARTMNTIPDEIVPAPIMQWIIQVKEAAGID